MSNTKLPEQWVIWLRDLKNRHFQASAVFGRYHRYTGIPLVILAALANAGIWGVLTDIGPDYETPVKIILAIIGSAVTILSAAQAFLGFDKRSEMHKNAAMKYSSLGADLEILMNRSQGLTDEDLMQIKDKWNTITENSPVLPERNTLTMSSNRRGSRAAED